jgi:hypothetical protein
MAERIYTTPTASIIAVNGDGQAVPLGLVRNLRLEKRWPTEMVREWGSYLTTEIIIMGVDATFSWGRAYSSGFDLVAQGLFPSDVTIPQHLPFMLRIVDHLSQRNVAMLYKAVVESMSLGGDERGALRSDVSGVAISVLLESELN